MSKHRNKRQFRQARHLKRREKSKRKKQKRDTIPLEFQTIRDIDKSKQAKEQSDNE